MALDPEFIEMLQATALTIGILTPGIAAIIGYFRSKFKCLADLRNDFESFKDAYGERQLRHSKAFIIICKRLDMVNSRQHPDRSPLNLNEDIETILKDENGNL